jgi:hypothetical protein
VYARVLVVQAHSFRGRVIDIQKRINAISNCNQRFVPDAKSNEEHDESLSDIAYNHHNDDRETEIKTALSFDWLTEAIIDVPVVRAPAFSMSFDFGYDGRAVILIALILSEAVPPFTIGGIAYPGIGIE